MVNPLLYICKMLETFLLTYFFKISSTNLLFEKYPFLFLITKIVSLVIVLLSIILFFSLLFFSSSSSSRVLTRGQILYISLIAFLFLINIKFFTVIEFLKASSHLSSNFQVLDYTIEGFFNYILYYTAVDIFALFLLITMYLNVYIVVDLTLKFFYAYLAQAELLVKTLLLILPKNKSFDKLIRILFWCFSFILLSSLSTLVLLVILHTADLFFVYENLLRILRTVFSSDYMSRLYLMLTMFCLYLELIVLNPEVHDIEDALEVFLRFYILLFIKLALLLPLYPPML